MSGDCTGHIEAPCPASGSSAASLSAALEGLIEQIRGRPISLQGLMDAVGDQGLLLICAIAALPFLFPISIPGTSLVFGAAIIVIGLAIAANCRPWLPRTILHRELDAERLVPILQRGARLVSRLDGWMRPRYSTLAGDGFVYRLNGLAIALAGALLMLPVGFIPLSNTLPGIAILALSTGMLRRDGLTVLAGHAVNLLTLLYFSAIALIVFSAGQGLRSLYG